MLTKRSIPVPTLSLAGTGVGHREQTDRLHNQGKESIPIINLSGNRCGHVPTSPRYFTRPEHQKPRPHVIQLAMDKVKDISSKPKALFKKLLTLHNNNRRIRSERREAAVLVFQVLLHYLDLETLKVGFSVGEKGFLSMDLNYIAEKACLSLIRTKRAIADMVKSGYLEVSRQCSKKNDGTFKGTASIRKITVKFFIDLGIDISKLFFAREWKRKKKEKDGIKASRKKLYGIIGAATTFSSKVKPAASTFKKVAQQSVMASKNLISQALELHKTNPEKSPSDYLRELQQAT